MPHTRLWAHFVWATKHRRPIITDELRPVLLSHISENALTKNIWIERINCVSDHLHALIHIKNLQNASNIAHLLKGEPSHWVKHTRLLQETFQWQKSFAAISVGESRLEQVISYIDNQQARHAVLDFGDECKSMRLDNYYEEILTEESTPPL